MILKNNKYFFESEKVKVFPCAYRGTKIGTEPETPAPFDPEAILNTENNWAERSNHVGELKRSYIRSWDNNTLKVVLGGYYFELSITQEDLDLLTSKTSETELYLAIKIDSKNIISTTYTTKILSPQYNAGIADLDWLEGGKYYFSGISVLAYTGIDTIESFFKATIDNSYIVLKIFDKNKDIIIVNKAPKALTQGKGINAVIANGDIENISVSNTGEVIKDNISDISNRADGNKSFSANKARSSGENSSAFNNGIAGGYSAFAANRGVADASDSVAFNDGGVLSDASNAAAFNDSYATKRNSFATGTKTRTSNEGEAVFGTFNDFKNNTNSIFTIGDGEDDKHRHNIVDVDKKIASTDNYSMNINGTAYIEKAVLGTKADKTTDDEIPSQIVYAFQGSDGKIYVLDEHLTSGSIPDDSAHWMTLAENNAYVQCYRYRQYIGSYEGLTMWELLSRLDHSTLKKDLESERYLLKRAMSEKELLTQKVYQRKNQTNILIEDTVLKPTSLFVSSQAAYMLPTVAHAQMGTFVRLDTIYLKASSINTNHIKVGDGDGIIEGNLQGLADSATNDAEGNDIKSTYISKTDTKNTYMPRAGFSFDGKVLYIDITK